jgi:hypothetical protein
VGGRVRSGGGGGSASGIDGAISGSISGSGPGIGSGSIGVAGFEYLRIGSGGLPSTWLMKSVPLPGPGSVAIPDAEVLEVGAIVATA